MPVPTAIHVDPFQATLYPADVKVVLPKPDQLIPLLEVIMVFVVSPTATHSDPLYATPFPPVENTAPREIQLIPSKEVASELVPVPTATHIPLFEPSLPYANPLVRVVNPDVVDEIPACDNPDEDPTLCQGITETNTLYNNAKFYGMMIRSGIIKKIDNDSSCQVICENNDFISRRRTN